MKKTLAFAASLMLAGFSTTFTLNVSSPSETVFDNGGQPWPFTNVVPAIAYDNGGQGVAYDIVPRTDIAGCAVNGSSYRPDYVNFKTSTWTAQPTVPYTMCGGLTLPSGGEKRNYQVTMGQPGPYTITLFTVNVNAGAIWDVYLDAGTTPVTTVTVGGGGDFSTVVATTSPQFTAATGNHKLRIVGRAGDPTGNYIGDFAGWQGGVVTTTVPAQAAAAGFNTAVVNADFSQPTILVGGSSRTTSNLAAYFSSCSGTDSTSGQPGTWLFYNTVLYTQNLNCADSAIVVDPLGSGANVLHITYPLSEMPPSTSGGNCLSGSNTPPLTCQGGLTFPTAPNQDNIWLPPEYYVKLVFKLDAVTNGGSMNGATILWQTETNFQGGVTAVDNNTLETQYDTIGHTWQPSLWEWGGQPANCDYDPSNGTYKSWCTGYNYSGSLDASASYHTLEGLVTSDEHSDQWQCLWIDNAFINCLNRGGFTSAANYTNHHRIMYFTFGSGHQKTADQQAWIKQIQIFACSGYASNTCPGPMISNCTLAGKC